MKVLLLEPHGDDALISCWHILDNPDNEITLVTLGNSRSSDGLKEFFPSIKSTEYLNLLQIPYDSHRARLQDLPKSRPDLWQWQIETTTQNPCWSGVKRLLQTELWRLFIRYAKDNLSAIQLAAPGWTPFSQTIDDHYAVVAPVGLVHPYHVCVGSSVFDYLNLDPFHFAFYPESPYRSRKWARRVELSYPLSNWNSCYASLDDFDVSRKELIFRSVYPTETKMLVHTRREVICNPSVLYYHPAMHSMKSLFKSYENTHVIST